MIFVTVGSQKFPFNRLLIEIERLKKAGIIEDELFAQIGHSDYLPESFPYCRFLDQKAFNEKIEKCDVLITHAGTGVIINALKQKKKIIAIPRLKKYGEHVDDHQLELLDQFTNNNLISSCIEVKYLEKILETIKESDYQDFVSNTDVFLENLNSGLEYYQNQIWSKKQGRMKNRIKKYYEYASTKLAIITKQKNYRFDSQTNIHYLEEQNNSEILLVIFSSCTRKGIKARYNYMKTLERFKTDKLFILDDYGYDSRGVYYLGKDMVFSIEEAVEQLISDKIQKKEYQKIIFIGSSKGGYAAINFGLRFPKSTLLLGAPQYKLGEFLTDSSNKLNETFLYITGNDIAEAENDKLKILDNHLLDVINKYQNNASSINIYIQYSDKEHTYEEHIQDLLKDLKKRNYVVNEEVNHYENHSDISLYFPNFLLKNIETILE